MRDIRIYISIAKGAVTFIPGSVYLLGRKKRTSKHSCSDAEFCYNLWLHILVFLNEKYPGPPPDIIGEIGNGGSFGVGICAILSGSTAYYSLELEDCFNVGENIALLESLVELFKSKRPVSYDPKINIPLKRSVYPEDLINPRFSDSRFVETLKQDILAGLKKSSRLIIVRDWHKISSLNLSFIFSRAVMEHVNSPASVYESAVQHIRINSLMLHDIELHSHGITNNPSGHLKIPAKVWRIIYGKRDYFLNRWTLSEHLEELEHQGCDILAVDKKYITEGKYKGTLAGVSILVRVANQIKRI